MLKTSRNPQASLMQFINSNQEFAPVAEMLQNGGNPKELFYKLSKDKGINDPNEILKIAQSIFR